MATNDRDNPLSGYPIPKKKSHRKTILWGILTLLLLAVAICAFMAFSTPSWYQPPHVSDPNIDAVAGGAQLKIAELVNHIQNAPVKSFSWSITESEVNSLLAIRFGAVQENLSTNSSTPAMKNQITDPMIHFTPGQITFAARNTKVPGSDPHGGVGSLIINVATLPPAQAGNSNQILIAVDGIALNSLPLPRTFIQGEVDKATPKLIEEIRKLLVNNMGNKAEHFMPDIIDWLTHAQQGTPFTPKLKTEGKRPFEIKELRVDEGRLTIKVGPPTKYVTLD